MFRTLLIVAVAFAISLPALTASPVSDGMPTYDEFVRTVHGYPYEASPERVARIMVGLGQLKQCIDKPSICAAIGTPDYSRLNYGKRLNDWLGSSWIYVVTKRSRSANDNDAVVTVYFDRSDRAAWITPRNIAGTKDIGEPDGKCA